MTEAYPLHWPSRIPRTPAHRRSPSKFDVTPDRARSEMLREIDLMGGRNVVVSTMQRRRQDGGIYAADLKRHPDDPGVAVYFIRKGQSVCFACDKHPTLWENMRAIGKTIEAMRGIERWGSAEMLDATFTGFAALPAPTDQRHWSAVVGVPAGASAETVQAAYKARAREYAARGDQASLAELNVAWDQAVQEAAQ